MEKVCDSSGAQILPILPVFPPIIYLYWFQNVGMAR